MDAATAWAEAMKFSNRPNPYPFFEELRKTPVAKVSEKTYVVTGYPEVAALAHDPRVSSDITLSPSGLFGEKQAQLDAAEAAQARNLSMLTTDPPEHDTMRRCADLGADEFMSKPFELATLLGKFPAA